MRRDGVGFDHHKTAGLEPVENRLKRGLWHEEFVKASTT